jgi:hypothetical protein
MSYQKVTFLEDLPDLEQLSENEEKAKRFIRDGVQINPNSGMYPVSNPTRMNVQAAALGTPPGVQPLNYHIVDMPPPPSQQILQSPQQQCVISCYDVYEHIENCPICRKFYKQDNTVYLVIIAILALMCALLLKKVLNI